MKDKNECFLLARTRGKDCHLADYRCIDLEPNGWCPIEKIIYDSSVKPVVMLPNDILPVHGRAVRQLADWAGRLSFLTSFIPAFRKAGYSESRNKDKPCSIVLEQ